MHDVTSYDRLKVKDFFMKAWGLALIGLVLVPLVMFSLFSPLFIIASFYYWYLFYREINLQHLKLRGSPVLNLLLTFLLLLSLVYFSLFFADMMIHLLRNVSLKESFSNTWGFRLMVVALGLNSVLMFVMNSHLELKKRAFSLLAPWSLMPILAAFFYFLRNILPLDA